MVKLHFFSTANGTELLQARSTGAASKVEATKEWTESDGTPVGSRAFHTPLPFFCQWARRSWKASMKLCLDDPTSFKSISLQKGISGEG